MPLENKVIEYRNPELVPIWEDEFSTYDDARENYQACLLYLTERAADFNHIHKMISDRKIWLVLSDYLAADAIHSDMKYSGLAAFKELSREVTKKDIRELLADEQRDMIRHCRDAYGNIIVAGVESTRPERKRGIEHRIYVDAWAEIIQLAEESGKKYRKQDDERMIRGDDILKVGASMFLGFFSGQMALNALARLGMESPDTLFASFAVAAVWGYKVMREYFLEKNYNGLVEKMKDDVKERVDYGNHYAHRLASLMISKPCHQNP